MPLYNKAPVVRETIERLLPIGGNIVIVDDGSTDDGAETLEMLSSMSPSPQPSLVKGKGEWHGRETGHNSAGVRGASDYRRGTVPFFSPGIGKVDSPRASNAANTYPASVQHGARGGAFDGLSVGARAGRRICRHVRFRRPILAR